MPFRGLCGENDDAVLVSIKVRQSRRVVYDLLFDAEREIQTFIIVVGAVRILDLGNRNYLRKKKSALVDSSSFFPQIIVWFQAERSAQESRAEIVTSKQGITKSNSHHEP